MADPNKVTVYCDSYLTSTTASELANGAWGTVVLPLTDADDEMLRQNIQRLKSEGLVRNVLFSVAGDYRAVIVNKSAYKAALAKAIGYYGIDGVELDPEDAGPKYFDVVVELTSFVASMGKMVIAAPSSNPQFWVEVLKATGHQMSWWNLQLTHGCDYGAWVAAIVESGAMPSEVAQSFVVPGYLVQWSTPDATEYEIESLRLLAAYLDGVFLRRWQDVQPRAAQWAKAVWSGLGMTRAEAERPWRALVSA
jgi:hypothetical protein